MNYILMHRKITVAEIEIDEEIASITGIGELFAPEHIPVGISFKNGRPYRSDLNDWWHGRSIPASRQNFREAAEELGVSSAHKLLTKCFGLSLSDQYWVNPIDSPLEWEKVNFFDNPFSDDVGDALFGKTPQGRLLDLTSPDNTSDGWLKKKWKITGGKRHLIKGGSTPFQQEPFNEVFASAIMSRLNISHVPYSILWEDNQPYSICENFITGETELISAYYIHNVLKIKNPDFLYEHFLDCCSHLGISCAQESLNKMLVLDYLIVNRDRHLTNFGAVRNAKTLKWVGLAPVFDSGTSLWNDQLTTGIDIMEARSKPFLDKHEEQIKLVKDFSWLDVSGLMGIEDEFENILKEYPVIDEPRRSTLCSSVKKRVDMLLNIINKNS